MNKNDLKAFIEANPKLVTMKESVAYPGLYVLKYTKKVFYDSLWNKYLENCRGTIIDKDYNIVSMPFQKIYNYGVESRSPVLDYNELVHVHRKINGFMVAVTWYNDDLLISTTGSTDSPFVAMAKELIDVKKFRDYFEDCEDKDFTLMFECCHKNDPHIIPEKEGMYLLGWRDNKWDSVVQTECLEYIADDLGTLHVESYQMTIGRLQSIVKTVKHEGFVFYTLDGKISAKIKSPYYLTNKFFARGVKTDKLMRADIKKSLDEEYYKLIDNIQENIVEYTALDEQQRLTYIRNFLA